MSDLVLLPDNKLRARRIVLLIVTVILLVTFFLIYPYIKLIVLMLLLSLIMTYFLKPGVVLLERVGLEKQLAILTVFAIVGSLISMMIIYIIPIFIAEAARLRENLLEVDFRAQYLILYDWLEHKFPGVANIVGLDLDNYSEWAEKLQQIASGQLDKVITFFAGAINLFMLIIVVPFLTFFFLRDGNAFSRLIIQNIPNRFFEMTLSLMYRIDKQLENYIISILIESVIIALLTWIGLEIIGVKYAFVLGIIHGLLNMIPYFGPFLAYIPIGGIVLLTYPQPLMGLFWMSIVLIAVQLIDNAVLKLVLLSWAVKIHPAVVIIIVLVGGNLAGALGMFIAIPAYAIIQVIVVDFYSHLKKYRII